MTPDPPSQTRPLTKLGTKLGINLPMSTRAAPDYDPHGALRKVSGPSLRPGGLELTEKALSLCGFTQGAKIVDVGCGPGATLKLLTDRGFDAQGVDPSPNYLAMAKAHGPTALGSLTALPQPDGWADGLFCECVLNLAENRSDALGEISRVLKPSGHFVLSDVFALNGPDGPDVTDGPLANIPLADGTCLGGAVTLPAALDELGRAGFQILFCQDYRAALNSLAAKLVWEYGPEGLKRLPSPKADCRPGAKAGKYTYALIVSQKNG